MPKRSSMPGEPNARAAIVSDGTGEMPVPDSGATKDPLAVELGRRGGQKGGKARAARMTAEERSEAARHAARKRWGG